MRQFWSNRLRLPDSVTRLTMSLETPEALRGELMLFADNLQLWKFMRKDHKTLSWLEEGEGRSVETWTGSSILNAQRWLRYEAQPEQIDYVIVSLTWGLDNAIPQHDDPVLDNQAVPPMSTRGPGNRDNPRETGAAVWVNELIAAGVPKGTPREATLEIVRAYRRREGATADQHAPDWHSTNSLGDRAVGRDEDEKKDEGVLDETETREFHHGDLQSHGEQFGGYKTRYEHDYHMEEIKRYMEMRKTDPDAAEAYKKGLDFWLMDRPCEF
ncbi:hypothetical protein BDZ85DRAFT_254795 [Elsinoe ampelina]|uniref:Uncharacterized protein n=1 Tax=Elsinoe ampelina TaxID=302913 RepID=A0A6A6GPS5_9PEZI|nr:hypothetical protein BDZ85DRAFT_254795 [Elsinoe ampelina]